MDDIQSVVWFVQDGITHQAKTKIDNYIHITSMKSNIILNPTVTGGWFTQSRFLLTKQSCRSG